MRSENHVHEPHDQAGRFLVLLLARASSVAGQDLNFGLQISARSPGQELDIRVTIHNSDGFSAGGCV